MIKSRERPIDLSMNRGRPIKFGGGLVKRQSPPPATMASLTVIDGAARRTDRSGSGPQPNHREQEARVMQATQVNVMVDVKQVLSGQSSDELLSELGGMQGVSRAWVSPRARRLVLVDYDPKVINSQRILGAVVRHGFDARLVGM